ncbi:FAD-dependent oxidoreductase [Leucobacter sp. gxy201]|uniref:protoporphyrinogen/coproporphyrinogen oxidase n=1 Tax=Leucobacter sp. gxy201 TaxID=2957200 RepID=UPI003DA0A066
MPGDLRVAVIGGGVAGLVAARELARCGAAVDVFESEPRPGGKIARARLDGRRFDIGAEAFATRGGVVAELIGELGLADAIVAPAPLGSWSVQGSRAVRFPEAGALGLPAAPLSRESVRALGVVGALRAACEPVLPRRIGGRARSVAELVRLRAGRRVLDRLVRPIALGVYSTPPEQLPVSAVPGLAEAHSGGRSLLRASRALRDRSRAAGSAVGALPGGMGPLVDALEADLRGLGAELHLGTTVSGVAHQGDDWRITATGPAASGIAEIAPRGYDSVVMAAPESVARRLLALPGAGAPAGSTVEIVMLLVDAPALDGAPRGTGALVAPAGDGAAAGGTRAKALTHVTAKWPDRGAGLPAGRHAVRLSYGRAGEPPCTLGLDDEQLIDLAARDAGRILGTPIARDRVVAWARRRWIMASPAPADAPEPPAGVVLVGDWVAGTGLAATIAHSRAATRGLADEAATRRRKEPIR